MLEGMLELYVPRLKEAGVSEYTDSSSSSEDAEVAESRPGVKPWAGFDCGCAASDVWEACVFPCCI